MRRQLRAAFKGDVRSHGLRVACPGKFDKRTWAFNVAAGFKKANRNNFLFLFVHRTIFGLIYCAVHHK
jgi:hypothetical protein